MIVAYLQPMHCWRHELFFHVLGLMQVVLPLPYLTVLELTLSHKNSAYIISSVDCRMVIPIISLPLTSMCLRVEPITELAATVNVIINTLLQHITTK